jgi:pimeloyl-ACP methyl ester carboxylesterase
MLDPRIDDRVRRNNTWYHRRNNTTALVFVHGILADSNSCWTHKPEDGGPELFWPDLILQDQRLGSLDIFLGGYFTATDAGEYGIDDCAAELFAALNRSDAAGNPSVLSYQTVIFICHSTGGIVARYLLDSYRDVFRGKKIGLVLIASPSDGSLLANWLSPVAWLFVNKLGQQLKNRNWSLKDLDRRFKMLVHGSNRDFELHGIEAYENKFIFHRKWIPDWLRVVTADSAGKYFGPARHLADTDHFSAAKPHSIDHPSHQLLVDFFKSFSADKTVVQRQSELQKVDQSTIRDPWLQPDASSDGIRTDTVRFETERTPHRIDLRRAILQIKDVNDVSKVVRIELKYDERISVLLEKVKRLYRDYESKVGEKANADDLSYMVQAINHMQDVLATLPLTLGLAINQLRQQSFTMTDNTIATAISRTTELFLCRALNRLAKWQLAIDLDGLFLDYGALHSTFENYVAFVDGIPVTNLASYRVRQIGDEERTVFAPINWGPHPLLMVRERFEKPLGEPYIPPVSFLFAYMFPQMFCREQPANWNTDWRLESVDAKNLDGEYIDHWSDATR